MNPLNKIPGQSTYQNQLDHEFDPLVQPKAQNRTETDWVKDITPRKYVPREDDLIRFPPYQLMKREVKVVSDSVSVMMAGNPPESAVNQNNAMRAFKTAATPKEGVLVDVSTGPEYRSQYPHGRNPYRQPVRLVPLAEDPPITREFNKIMAEMQNLERHIQNQDWFTELKEVFPAKGVTDEETEEQRCQEQLQKLRDMETLRREPDLQRQEHYRQNQDLLILKNLEKIRTISQEKSLQQHGCTRKMI